jgi:hypothetical protein
MLGGHVSASTPVPGRVLLSVSASALTRGTPTTGTAGTITTTSPSQRSSTRTSPGQRSASSTL